MRFAVILGAFFASAVLAVEGERELSSTANVYVQIVGESAVTHLAEIQYSLGSPTAEITSYDAPQVSKDAELLRIGVYDSNQKTWISSTTATSSESFAKGYAPIFTLSVDGSGDIVSIACRSAKIDAGQTRDFGPKVRIVEVNKGVAPELNKPVVLKGGKEDVPVPEKTMLQKYWWVAAGALVLMLAGGGDGK